MDKLMDCDVNASAKPSELVLMAINNGRNRVGSTEEEIVSFIADNWGMDAQEVVARVRATLTNQVAIGLVASQDGYYKMVSTGDGAEGNGKSEAKSSTSVARGKRKAKRRKTVSGKSGAKRHGPVTILGTYKCKMCGKTKKVHQPYDKYTAASL